MCQIDRGNFHAECSISQFFESIDIASVFLFSIRNWEETESSAIENAWTNFTFHMNRISQLVFFSCSYFCFW